jgi:single stranded DNA-binding protein
VARRRPSFLKVNIWRGQAEHLANSLSKGDQVMVTGRLRQRSWETPEGDKRSVTEIEADEVGASLKWATAKVERTSQRGNGERTQAGSGRPNAAATLTTSPPSEHPRAARPREDHPGGVLHRYAIADPAIELLAVRLWPVACCSGVDGAWVGCWPPWP